MIVKTPKKDNDKHTIEMAKKEEINAKEKKQYRDYNILFYFNS